MKVFFISLAVFVLMLGLILWNTLYINRLSFVLLERVDELETADTDRRIPLARELLELWESHTLLVGISVGYPTVDRVSEQAAVLCATAEYGDEYAFRTALTLFRDAVEDTRRLERLPFHP